MAIPLVNLNIDPKGYAGPFARGRAYEGSGLDIRGMLEEAMRLRNAIAQAQIRQINEGIRRGREEALEGRNRENYEREFREKLLAMEREGRGGRSFETIGPEELGRAAASTLDPGNRLAKTSDDFRKLGLYMKFLGPQNVADLTGTAGRGFAMLAGQASQNAPDLASLQGPDKTSPYSFAEGDPSSPYPRTSTRLPGIGRGFQTSTMLPGGFQRGTLPGLGFRVEPAKLSPLTTWGAPAALRSLINPNERFTPSTLRGMTSQGSLGHLFAGGGDAADILSTGGGMAGPSAPSPTPSQPPPVSNRYTWADRAGQMAPPIRPYAPSGAPPPAAPPSWTDRQVQDAVDFERANAGPSMPGRSVMESAWRMGPNGPYKSVTTTGDLSGQRFDWQPYTPQQVRGAVERRGLNPTKPFGFRRGTLPGTVPRTGDAKVHRGEIIVSRDQADPRLIRLLIQDKMRKLMTGQMDGKGTGPGYQEGTVTNMSLENPELEEARGVSGSWNNPLSSPSSMGGEGAGMAGIAPGESPGAPIPGGGGTPGGVSKPSKPWWWLRMRGAVRGANPFAKNPNWGLTGPTPGVAPEVMRSTIGLPGTKGGNKTFGLSPGMITKEMVSPETLQNQGFQRGTLGMRTSALRRMFGENPKPRSSYQEGTIEDILKALDPEELSELESYLSEGEKNLRERLAAGPKPRNVPRETPPFPPKIRSRDIRRGKTPSFTNEDLLKDLETYDPLTSPSSIPPERELVLRPPLGRRVGTPRSETRVTSGSRAMRGGGGALVPLERGALVPLERGALERAAKVAESPAGREALEEAVKKTKNPKVKLALLGLLAVAGGAALLGRGEEEEDIETPPEKPFVGPPEPTPDVETFRDVEALMGRGLMDVSEALGRGFTARELGKGLRHGIEGVGGVGGAVLSPIVEAGKEFGRGLGVIGEEEPPSTKPPMVPPMEADGGKREEEDEVTRIFREAEEALQRAKKLESRGPDKLQTIRETHYDKMDRLRLREEGDRLWKYIERNVDKMSPEEYQTYFQKAQRLDRLADVADKRIASATAREEGETERLRTDREKAEERLRSLQETRAGAISKREAIERDEVQKAKAHAKDLVEDLEGKLAKAEPKGAEWNSLMGLLTKAYQELLSYSGVKIGDVPIEELGDNEEVQFPGTDRPMTLREYLTKQYLAASEG